MTKEEAVAEIAKLVDEAYAALATAEGLADKHGLEFDFSPEYGMGGTYYGYEPKWSNAGWNPSSQSC